MVVGTEDGTCVVGLIRYFTRRANTNRYRQRLGCPLRYRQKNIPPEIMSDIPQEGHAMTCHKQSSGQIIPKNELSRNSYTTQAIARTLRLDVQSPARMCAKNCAHPAIFFFLSLAAATYGWNGACPAENSQGGADKTQLVIFYLRSRKNLRRRANEYSKPAPENEYNWPTELLGQPAIKDN